jgi:hypothetical protein
MLELTLSLLGITTTRIIPSQFQKTVIMTLPADGLFWNSFFLGDLRMVPFYGLPFCFWFKMMDPDFHCCNNLG